MKIFKISLLVFSLFILTGAYSASATTVEDNVLIKVINVCPEPTVEYRTVDCPLGKVGTGTEARQKSAYPGCVFGDWVMAPGSCGQAAATGTLGGSGCYIATGASSCPVTLNWEVVDSVPGQPTSITKPVDQTIPGTSSYTGTVHPNVEFGTTTFYLNHSGATLNPDGFPVTASCGSSDEWKIGSDGKGTCEKKVVPPDVNPWVMPTCPSDPCGTALQSIPYTCPTGNCSGAEPAPRVCPATAATSLCTPPPGSDVTLTASPSKIRKGGSSTITWKGVDSTCTANVPGFDKTKITGSVKVSGLQKTTTYTLTCGGVVKTATVTVDTTTFIEQ